MQGEADNSAAGMEENGVIEPLDDEELPDGARDVTSDYDPSEEETTFGSVTSSVGGHVWEYGRYATALRAQRSMIRNGPHAETPADATMLSDTGDTPYPTTRRNTSGSLCATRCSRTCWAVSCTPRRSVTTPRRFLTWARGSGSGPLKVRSPGNSEATEWKLICSSR